MKDSRKVFKMIKGNFYENMLLRGETPTFVPLKGLRDWVRSLDHEAKMVVVDESDNQVRFKYFSSDDKELPSHFHDKNETFDVIKGRLTMEYIRDNKYQRVDLNEGDVLTIPANSIHRGTIHDEVEAILTFDF